MTKRIEYQFSDEQDDDGTLRRRGDPPSGVTFKHYDEDDDVVATERYSSKDELAKKIESLNAAGKDTTIYEEALRMM